MGKMVTMYMIHIDDEGYETTYKYRIPERAVKEYLDTDDDSIVADFMYEEYNSEDTENIMELCDREGYAYWEVNS